MINFEVWLPPYRAHYFVTTAAKAVTTEYYGKPAAHAYFEGCSNGGRQAMMMAQRYPDLFDGIVAGAPSQFYGDTLLSLVWTGHSRTPVLGQPPVLSDEKRAMMTARAHAACDAQDGLVDQQITNPRACVCGYLGHPSGKCRCTPDQIIRYRARISGPFLDRIDLRIEVAGVPADALRNTDDGESSAVVQARVESARNVQLARQGKANALLMTKEIDRHCQPDDAGDALLRQAIARLTLLAQAYHRVLKVVRTIADLAEVETLAASHIAEAIGYRRGMDRL